MNKILTSVVCSLITANTAFAAGTSRPKLVVGIIVDQLRTDYIEYLSGHFTDGGFRRLMQKGFYLRDVDFRVPGIDAVSATAMLMTGNYPSQTGVPAATVYNKDLKRNMPTLLKSGSVSDYSPEALRLSTVSDEISIDGIGLGAVYSIAQDPCMAVIMAGHSGTSALWFNQETGRWTVPSYYNKAQQPVMLNGSRNSLAARMDTMQWKPAMPLEKYPGIPAQKRYYPFNHTFSRSDKDIYKEFFHSPLGNREITDIAIGYMKSLRLGNRGDAIDMLDIAYSAAPYKYVRDNDFRLELEDTYIRLDRDLDRLFTAIDKSVGLDNALIFLSSTGYYDDAAIDDPKYRIPGGDFSIKKAVSLANSYLSALHGNGDYIDNFSGQQLYLNRQMIEGKRLKLAEVAQETATFLNKMSGVAEAYTLDDIFAERSENHRKLKLLIDPKSSGDIYVDFTPGWTLVYDNTYPVVKKPVRNSFAVTPAFFMGSEIKPETVSTPVDAAELAPTMSRLLRIRSPNGSARRGLTIGR